MQVKDITKVDIIKLKLDVDNPRFAELYNGSDDQDELIEYLLHSESATDIVKELDESQEFYADRPLWVIEDKGGSYLVKDGNRRFAAVLALRKPSAFGLSEKRQTIDEIPVIIYPSGDEVDKRIRMEHTHSSFREWDRIAKALEVYKMRSSGTAVDSPVLKEFDSAPQSLVKLASFYYEAVKIGKDDLKKLLRRGRGSSGGKTIVFERLFSYRTSCGYDFNGKPTYDINVTDRKLFDSYVSAMIAYLKANPDTTHKTVDDAKETFLNKLESYGFKPSKKAVSGKTTKASTATTQASTSTAPSAKGGPRKSIKKAPKYTRKSIPRTVDQLVFECYNLDSMYFTNSKVAMTRVTFECVLKYIIEQTEYAPGKKLSQSAYFRNAYFDRHGNKLTTTNFDKLKDLFGQLVLDTGIRRAIEDFKLDRPHQIIHNYNVGAIPADATAITDNLIPLLEFMLQEEQDLLNGLDKNKL